MRSLLPLSAKPSRRRGVRRREVFSAQFDGGQSAAALCTSIHLGCDVLEQRIVLTASESDFIFSQGTITGYKGLGGVVDIPSTIHGKPVVAIGDSAFKDNTTITSVVIPRSITTIGYFAFQGDTALTSVSIGQRVASIGGNAFAYAGLKSLEIPGSVKVIGQGAFRNNFALASVTIGKGVQTIGFEAFRSNTALSSVTLSNTVKSIGGYAFQGDAALTSVTMGGGVTTISDHAFQGTALKILSLPNSLKTIGPAAFQGNFSLGTVKMGTRVTSIGNNAFDSCNALTSVTFTAKAPFVGGDAFKGVPFGARAIRAAGLSGYGPNGTLWNNLFVLTPGVTAAPTVTVNTASLAQNLDTCTITGARFLAGMPSANTVTFNLGAVGEVTAATTTTLTVKFTKQPTSTAPLTVIVANVFGTSGVPKQVATIVAADAATDSPEVPFPELPAGAGPIDSDAPKSFAITRSGLQYRVLRQGNGAKPSATGTVTVNYQGWLDDGKVFDSSYPNNSGPSFKLTEVIAGFAEGMQLVGKGGMIELAIPSNLGYGSTGGGSAIPPNSTLHFLVELLDVR